MSQWQSRRMGSLLPTVCTYCHMGVPQRDTLDLREPTQSMWSPRVLGKTSVPALLPDSCFPRVGYLPCAAASLCNVGELKSWSLWHAAAEQSRNSGSLPVPHHMGLLEGASAFNQLYLGTEQGGCAGRGEHPRQAGITATASHWIWHRSDGTLKHSLGAVLESLMRGSVPQKGNVLVSRCSATTTPCSGEGRASPFHLGVGLCSQCCKWQPQAGRGNREHWAAPGDAPKAGGSLSLPREQHWHSGTWDTSKSPGYGQGCRNRAWG